MNMLFPSDIFQNKNMKINIPSEKKTQEARRALGNSHHYM